MEYAGVWVNFRKKNHRYIIKGVMQNTWGNSKGVTLRPTGGNPRDDPPNYVPVDFGGGQGPKREVSWGRGAKDDPRIMYR